MSDEGIQLADPREGPTPDPTEASRAEARRLRELWAMGDERAGLAAEQLERHLEELTARDAAAALVAIATTKDLDDAIEAKRAEAAKTEPAPAPADEEREPIR